MKYACLLALLFPLVASAQSYVVTGGSHSFQRLSSPNMLSLTDSELSAAISPSGFSFEYFGASYTEFKVCSNGFMVMGSGGSTASSVPFPSWAPGLTIAPLWRDLYPTQCASGDGIGWEFSGGVLAVEWAEVPCYVTGYQLKTPHVNMQVLLDTATGEIEFRYGASASPTAGPPEPDANWYSCSIAGPTGGTQEIIYGTQSGFIGAKGELIQYQPDRFIHFEPQFAPVITGNPVLDAYVGQSWSYTFSVSGNPAPSVNVSGLPAWLSLSGNTISGTPGAGDIGLSGVITIDAVNSLGSDQQQFQVTVTALPPAGSPGQGSGGGSGGCTAGVDVCDYWLIALVIGLGLLAWSARRKKCIE